jgi:hypothetical protein
MTRIISSLDFIVRRSPDEEREIDKSGILIQ